MAKLDEKFKIGETSYTVEQLKIIHRLIFLKTEKKPSEFSKDEYVSQVTNCFMEIEWCNGDEMEALNRWKTAETKAYDAVIEHFKGRTLTKSDDDEAKKVYGKVIWEEFNKPILDFMDEYFDSSTTHH